MKHRPRICIDARLDPGFSGGIEQVVIGLARGLSSLDDGDEEYYFLAYPGADEWLAPYLNDSCHLLYSKRSLQQTWRRTIASRFPLARKMLENIGSLAVERAISIPKSCGTIEKAGIDLMHFTFQAAFLTDIPSIYHPHDLQHLHLPEYFSDYERRGRTLVYKRFCDQARMVAVSSSWVRRDLEEHLDLPHEKIAVVPLAPSTEAYTAPTPEDLASTRKKFNLPDAFAFYPAQTWPHKNHLGLIEAAATLKERFNLHVPLVFSGRKGAYYPSLEGRIKELEMEKQVQFLGFVTPLELQSLYRLCRCVIIPTKFEAASFPLWEAFLAGAPTACSNVTSLPKQAGDAALIFDPDNTDDIAACLRRLWEDGTLRTTLAERGAENVSRFTWRKTALGFRAHYRRILGLQLTREDNAILNAAPIL